MCLTSLRAAALLLLFLAAAVPARADEFKIRSPIVDYHEIEIEHFGQTTFDGRGRGFSNNQFYNNEIEVGIVPNLKLGIEGNLAAPNGENLQYDATAAEAFLQLTPQGKYFADFGFFFEAERPWQHSGEPAAAIMAGPLIQSEYGHIGKAGLLHTVNLLFSHQIGHNASGATPLYIAWQSRLRVNPWFQPGFEYFGLVNGDTPDQHRLGPVIASHFLLSSLGLRGGIRTELAYLAGLTPATEHGTLRWHVEFEVPF